jgi:hypothetical protein
MPSEKNPIRQEYICGVKLLRAEESGMEVRNTKSI